MASWVVTASVSALIVFERRDAGSSATMMVKRAPATIDPRRVPSFESALSPTNPPLNDFDHPLTGRSRQLTRDDPAPQKRESALAETPLGPIKKPRSAGQTLSSSW